MLLKIWTNIPLCFKLLAIYRSTNNLYLYFLDIMSSSFSSLNFIFLKLSYFLESFLIFIQISPILLYTVFINFLIKFFYFIKYSQILYIKIYVYLLKIVTILKIYFIFLKTNFFFWYKVLHKFYNTFIHFFIFS